MAMLLGTMKVLVEMKEELEGTVYCCFEEAEEDITGVAAMMEALQDYRLMNVLPFMYTVVWKQARSTFLQAQGWLELQE